MIKFALRKNLKYPFQLLWNIVRNIETILISELFNYDGSLLYTPIMFLGEFSAGLIIYIYEKQFFPKDDKIEKQKKSNKIILIHSKYNFAKDSDKKILFLIFYASFCDFVQFVMTLQFAKFINISDSLELRLRGFFTIYDALFYYYVLRFSIFRHQFLSLIIIGLFLVIIIIIEFIFQDINIFLSYRLFILFLTYIIIIQFFSAMVDSVEKYLFEYNHINTFLVLMIEGIFGFILSFIYSLFHNPFDNIIKLKKNNSRYNFYYCNISISYIFNIKWFEKCF